MDWLDLLVGVARGITLLYAIPLVGLWLYTRRHPDGMGRRGALSLLPDLPRTPRRLVPDRDLPARSRVGGAAPAGLSGLTHPPGSRFSARHWVCRGRADRGLGAAGLIGGAASALRRQWARTGLRFVERLAGLFEPEHGWGPAAKTP